MGFRSKVTNFDCQNTSHPLDAYVSNIVASGNVWVHIRLMLTRAGTRVDILSHAMDNLTDNSLP